MGVEVLTCWDLRLGRRRIQRAQLKRSVNRDNGDQSIIKIQLHAVVERFGIYRSCRSSTVHRLSRISVGPISWIYHLLSVWSWISFNFFIYTLMKNGWQNLYLRMALRRAWQNAEHGDWYTVSAISFLQMLAINFLHSQQCPWKRQQYHCDSD